MFSDLELFYLIWPFNWTFVFWTLELYSFDFTQWLNKDHSCNTNIYYTTKAHPALEISNIISTAKYYLYLVQKVSCYLSKYGQCIDTNFKQLFEICINEDDTCSVYCYFNIDLQLIRSYQFVHKVFNAYGKLGLHTISNISIQVKNTYSISVVIIYRCCFDFILNHKFQKHITADFLCLDFICGLVDQGGARVCVVYFLLLINHEYE